MRSVVLVGSQLSAGSRLLQKRVLLISYISDLFFGGRLCIEAIRVSMFFRVKWRTYMSLCVSCFISLVTSLGNGAILVLVSAVQSMISWVSSSREYI